MNLIKLMNNFHVVSTSRGDMYFFSYEALIGVKNQSGTFVSENDWGRTTGKHINFIKNNYEGALQIPHMEVLFIPDDYNHN